MTCARHATWLPEPVGTAQTEADARATPRSRTVEPWRSPTCWVPGTQHGSSGQGASRPAARDAAGTGRLGRLAELAPLDDWAVAKLRRAATDRPQRPVGVEQLEGVACDAGVGPAP